MPKQTVTAMETLKGLLEKGAKERGGASQKKAPLKPQWVPLPEQRLSRRLASGREVRRRSLLPLALERLLLEAFFQDAGHLLWLEAQLGADLLRPKALPMLLRQGDHLAEGLGNIFLGATGQPPAGRDRPLRRRRSGSGRCRRTGRGTTDASYLRAALD
jgi:hypothetical protein